MSEKKEEIEPFPFIEGDKIDLMASGSQWVNLICKWINDPKVRHYSRNMFPHTIEEIKKWQEPPANRRMPEWVGFIIWHKQDKKAIGEVGFGRINWVNRNANLYGLIGEPSYWGKGIIGEAAKLVIRYGFTELNFHKIFAGVYSPNERSLRAAEKLGFQKEATLKEEMYVDGKFVDSHRFALFKRDWLKEIKD